MFRSLKEKLKLFRKKAIKELEATEAEAGDNTGKGVEKQVSQSKIKPDQGAPPTFKTDDKKKTKSGKKPVIERKRSRPSQEPSLKRIIETETADQTPWKEVQKKDILVEEDNGWFAKAIPESKLENILWDLEVALLESDVALPVVEEIKSLLKKQLLDKKIKRGSNLDSVIESALRNAVLNVLSTKIIHFDNFIDKHDKPVKLMFVGVNGTGKTSAIAKIAFRLKKQKRSSVIAAGDTFRAGAIEQLEKHANKLGIKLIKDKAGSDPAAIAYDAIEHAKARHKEIVLIDTAGRMQTNKNLMDEMRKIKRVSEPDLIIFVGDALQGNDVVEQALEFDKVVGIDAAVLTKLDADAKGGSALSIAHAVGKPILFVTVGQRYGDLIPFNPEWMVNRLFE
ncbi:MAG: signal recognition particle-docking protein FtsY [Thermoplasmata archaeon]|nr:signal recognition particle-docking protein FtsY [Thermoplasmata archaeon]